MLKESLKVSSCPLLSAVASCACYFLLYEIRIFLLWLFCSVVFSADFVFVIVLCAVFVFMYWLFCVVSFVDLLGAV